jgi:hypothetical protein
MLPVRSQTQIQGIESRTLVNFPPDVEGVFTRARRGMRSALLGQRRKLASWFIEKGSLFTERTVS